MINEEHFVIKKVSHGFPFFLDSKYEVKVPFSQVDEIRIVEGVWNSVSLVVTQFHKDQFKEALGFESSECESIAPVVVLDSMFGFEKADVIEMKSQLGMAGRAWAASVADSAVENCPLKSATESEPVQMKIEQHEESAV